MSRHHNLFCRRRIAGPRALSSSDIWPSSELWPLTSGLTLVEMLVAMAITLVMMAAVVNLFANVGASVRNRRATIEMGGQLRLVRLRLHNDLVGATCPTLTWQRPGDDNGYLEIVEGQWSDKNPSGLGWDRGVPHLVATLYRMVSQNRCMRDATGYCVYWLLVSAHLSLFNPG